MYLRELRGQKSTLKRLDLWPITSRTEHSSKNLVVWYITDSSQVRTVLFELLAIEAVATLYNHYSSNNDLPVLKILTFLQIDDIDRTKETIMQVTAYEPMETSQPIVLSALGKNRS